MKKAIIASILAMTSVVSVSAHAENDLGVYNCGGVKTYVLYSQKFGTGIQFGEFQFLKGLPSQVVHSDKYGKIYVKKAQNDNGVVATILTNETLLDEGKVVLSVGKNSVKCTLVNFIKGQ